MRWAGLSLIVLLCMAGAPAVAQPPSNSTSTANPPTVTIQTTSRNVVLDVIVKDKAGNPVHSLKADDFIVLEDGKRQQLKAFEENQASGPTSNHAPAVKLPPDTYTNYVSSSEPGAVNIILFDSLNSDRMSLTSARKQLLSYLSKLPGNTQVALFTLDGELHLIHGFTEDNKALIEAAQRLSSTPSSAQRKARDVTDELAEARFTKMGDSMMYPTLRRFLWSEYDGKAESRTLITMEALKQLARSMAVVPGRKNLIWISGGIPFDPANTDPQMQKTAALLAATQISVYPIDVRGLAWVGADGAAFSQDVYQPVGGEYSEVSGQADELSLVHETMLNLAHLTGGHAYLNNNDVSGQIQDVVQTNSSYYTLAYRPEKQDWNGAFRKLTVQTKKPGLKVQCRPGYYAVADPFGGSDLGRTFSLTMQPEVPPSTALIIQARVLPPDAPDKAVQVDFLVDMHDLEFVQSPDHRVRPDVMFVSAVWGDDGKPRSNVVATYQQILRPAELQALLKSGLRVQQQLQLKPGSYQLKLGVLDRLSGKMGTLAVPLTVPSQTASK